MERLRLTIVFGFHRYATVILTKTHEFVAPMYFHIVEFLSFFVQYTGQKMNGQDECSINERRITSKVDASDLPVYSNEDSIYRLVGRTRTYLPPSSLHSSLLPSTPISKAFSTTPARRNTLEL